MNIISDTYWDNLETLNQAMIQKWKTLQHARSKGNRKEILAAEMQYLAALQNVNTLLQVAISPVNQKRTRG